MKFSPAHTITLKLHQYVFLAEKRYDHILRKELDITFSQFLILMIVNWHPEISQAKLAVCRDMTQAAVSRHVNLLEKRGFLKRTSHKENKREYRIVLTKRGMEYVAKAHSILEKEIEAISAVLNMKERKTVEQSIEKMTTKLKGRLGPAFMCNDKSNPQKPRIIETIA